MITCIVNEQLVNKDYYHGGKIHEHLLYRPDEDTSSQHSTFTFYQSLMPKAQIELIGPNYRILDKDETSEDMDFVDGNH